MWVQLFTDIIQPFLKRSSEVKSVQTQRLITAPLISLKIAQRFLRGEKSK